GTLGPDVLVLLDHEGGRVHRLPPPFTRFPPAAAVGRSGDPHRAVAVARAMARELRAAGFDSGLAPVLDCLLNPANTVIDDRAFGTAPDIIAACGVAFVEALLSEGLVPVAKHFPGHGRTSVDSHLALPGVDATVDQLEPWDRGLVCRGAGARHEAAAAIGRDIDRGALDLAPAVQRRQAVRQLIATAGPRPDVSVIGCAEHRALAEEVAQRARWSFPAPG